MTVGARIKKARQNAGLTQKQLADKLGVSYVNVSQWESGRRNPKYETLSRIAAALGISITDLGVEPTDYLHHPVELLSGLSAEDISAIAKKLEEQFGYISPEEKAENARRYESYVVKTVGEYLSVMNEDGQTRVLNYTRDLAKIPEYQKDQEEE